MNTVGKIFNATVNNYDDFTTKMVDSAGNPPVVSTEGVYVDGSENQFTILPDVKHSFGAFNVLADVEIVNGTYSIDIGLKGAQMNWPVNMYATLQAVTGGTQISLGDARNGTFRFTEFLPVIFTSNVKIRVAYSNLQWDILILYRGAQYQYTYRYQRPAVNGHVTSVFAFNCEGAEMNIKKLIVDIPIVKGQTLFVGDSITWGSRRPFGTHTFAEQYNANDAKSSIFASGSARSGDVLACFEAIKLIAPSEIVLLIGDNDPYTDPVTFASNITTILDDWIHALPANGVPMPTVVLCNLTPEQAQPGYAALRDVIDGFTLAVPHRKVDTWRALARTDNPDLAQPQYLVDGVHLSGAGHDKIYSIL